MENLLDVPQASQFLAVSEDTIRYWIKHKRVPFTKLNGSVRFSPATLNEWIAANTCQPQAQTE